MLTRSTIYVIQIAYAVFICSITRLAEEPRLARTSPAWILDDHGFIEIFV
jgi:hypothetical protein